MKWALAEAKNKFSEVVRRALAEGPQLVTRRDRAVVVLSLEDYERLQGKRPSLKAFLLLEEGPDLDGVALGRDRTPMRDVDL